MAADGKRAWHDEAGAPKKLARRDGGTAAAAAATASKPTTAGTTSKPTTAGNPYAGMFLRFRDRLDAQHDRRERVVKASRDITALSKKAIFALQRVRSLNDGEGGSTEGWPRDVAAEVEGRLAAIGGLLAGAAPALQGLDRGRHARVMYGLEELVEALAFRHYLLHRTLLGYEEACAVVAEMCKAGGAEAEKTAAAEKTEAEKTAATETSAAAEKTAATPTDTPTEAAPPPLLSDDAYLMGVFDVSGEMMRFATTAAALQGDLGTLVADMQALQSFFLMLPQNQRQDKGWRGKMQVLQTSVEKVERLGYDLRVRGSERPGFVEE